MRSRPDWRGSGQGLEGSSRPTTLTPCSSIVFPATEASMLPPVSTARSTMTLPGFIPFRTWFPIMRGARRPKIWAVVMTTSDWWQTLSMAFCCNSVCSLLRAPAYPSSVDLSLAQVDSEEPGSHGTDLFLHLGAGVEGLDPGTKALCRGNRLQSCYTRSNHENAGREGWFQRESSSSEGSGADGQPPGRRRRSPPGWPASSGHPTSELWWCGESSPCSAPTPPGGPETQRQIRSGFSKGSRKPT